MRRAGKRSWKRSSKSCSCSTLPEEPWEAIVAGRAIVAADDTPGFKRARLLVDGLRCARLCSP
jgi:hypothetical protein